MTEPLIRHICQRAGRAYCGVVWTVSRTMMPELVCPQCVTLLQAERRAAGLQSGSHPPLR